MRTQLEMIEHTVEQLAKLVRDGNGQRPLLTIVALHDDRISRVEGHITRVEINRWQLVMALWSAILSLGVSIVAAILVAS